MKSYFQDVMKDLNKRAIVSSLEAVKNASSHLIDRICQGKIQISKKTSRRSSDFLATVYEQNMGQESVNRSPIPLPGIIRGEYQQKLGKLLEIVKESKTKRNVCTRNKDTAPAKINERKISMDLKRNSHKEEYLRHLKYQNFKRNMKIRQNLIYNNFHAEYSKPRLSPINRKISEPRINIQKSQSKPILSHPVKFKKTSKNEHISNIKDVIRRHSPLRQFYEDLAFPRRRSTNFRTFVHDYN